MKQTKNRHRFVIYLWIGLAWFCLWEISILSQHPETFWQRTVNEMWRDFYLIALNCILFEYAIPFIIKKRRFLISNILIGVFLIWAMLMLYSFGLYGWRAFGVAINIYTSFRPDVNLHKELEFHAGSSIPSIFFFGILRHIYYYQQLKQTTQRLRIEKQEAELNYLKSQTNPHFLFNTLNNIYSLARDKSDLAPESILRLSKILRYMLYETNGEYIAIEQELKIMTDYIALEKLRYDESLRINFNHDVEDMGQALPPLLLIPLVENAFKHGVSETRGVPFIIIHLSVSKRQLLFVVENSTDAPEASATIKENIGLSNLRRQLELLYTEYNLTVNQKKESFTAVLKINLASHV
jgi:two-component system, LytTR family, sensor kinase